MYFPDEPWNYMTIFYYNRYYILKSLLCYLLKIKCIISVPISGALFDLIICIFGRKISLGNLRSFDPGRLPWGWAFEQNDLSSNPLSLPGLPSPQFPPPPSSLTFVFRQVSKVMISLLHCTCVN